MLLRWPHYYKEANLTFNKYWTLKGDLSIEHDCIAYLGRLLIQPTLRKSCMDSLHKGHPGMSKMCHRAQQSLYWSGINQKVRSKVDNCMLCEVLAGLPRTSNFYRNPIQTLAKIEMDLFLCKGKWYLIVCDDYSKFPVFRLLPPMSSKNVISALKCIISEYGNMKEIISENEK